MGSKRTDTRVFPFSILKDCMIFPDLRFSDMVYESPKSMY